jgi:uncharacterized repeat protein (TIGR01451 family)
MKKTVLALGLLSALLVGACGQLPFFTPTPPTGPTSDSAATQDALFKTAVAQTLTARATSPVSSALNLSKTASSQTYSAPDQTITYTYVITNTGTTPLGPAQFTITDSQLGAPFNCGPAATTLASGQSITCSMNYQTTAADMSLASITNSATASGGGQTSAPATFTVTNLVGSPTPTPQATATLASTVPSATETPATTTTTSTAGFATATTIPQGGTVTATLASGQVTPIWTLAVRTYGTLPPAVPFSQVTLINKANTEAYISLQVTMPDGKYSILEYPVEGRVRIQAPVGSYLYVAWVGGRKMVGEFRLKHNDDLSITLFKDSVVIK